MRTRLSTLLVGICGLMAMIAAAPATTRAAAQPFSVTTSLDGRATLPTRIRWTVHPKLPVDRVLEVDFVIDGKVRWAETEPPFVYGGHEQQGRNEGYLVTTWLSAGPHRFAARVKDSDGRVETHGTVARVAASPEPPAELQGIWSRTVTNADLAKSDPRYGEAPPIGSWKLVFDRTGIWELDSTGAGVIDEYSVEAGQLAIGAPIQEAPIIEDHIAVSRYGADNIGGYDCAWNGPFGRYTWSVSGDSLTLTATGELCGQRRAVLEGTWTRAS